MPDEDQGYLFAVVQMPPAASLERTSAAVGKLTQIARDLPVVDGIASLTGFNLLTGLTTSYNGTAFIRLKPWHERKDKRQTAGAIQRTLMGMLNTQIKDANVLVLNPPPIRGLGSAGGFEFLLQDRAGGDPKRFGQVLQAFLAEARKRPELGFVFTNYNDSIPQIEYEINRDAVKTYGVSLSDVFRSEERRVGKECRL